ncbi:hypothetical protein SAMN05421644_1242 [Allochromatium warmingii]|uniref:Uncharacterized protein n=1 Tax=Allochromatium warmingii TaxID=61595 RepID=A0A1H3GB94_ALLWA|nr:hypothetical protein [Allochromatium warmingii]SDY00536.1 hypothetical protein SAMN05421644_1242 [Allochromatium warmingii]
MKIGDLVCFHQEHFFEGAVQLRWIQDRPEQAQHAACAYVFHGPRYHGAGEAEQEGISVSHRLKDSASFVGDLLDSILSGLAGAECNPYLLAVAGYGAGKSHLATAIASLLSAPDSAIAASIIDQLTQADAAIGQTVSNNLAQLGRPVLVLALDGMAGFHLGNALSQAVFAQLERYGVDAEAIRALSPRFQTAEQFVERNLTIRADAFARQLPDWTAEAIVTALRQQDEAVYTAVDAIYRDANGAPIPVIGQESAQELLNTLCEVYCGPDGAFASVLIIFDEFGRYLEYAAEKPQLAGDSALQQIFQGVQDNSGKVRFVGFIQYELKTYLKRFSSADLRQLQRYITRFDAADKSYLSTNLETIVAHLLGKDEAALDALWQRTGADAAQTTSWQRLAAAVPGFANHPVWYEPHRFAQVIARGSWPLHPLATWFLTRQSDVVQSRSALTIIKDVLEQFANRAAEDQRGLRRISAAELVLNGLLAQMIAAERETGASVAETLQLLLEKLQAHLTPEQRLVLAGVAVLEKLRIAKQQQSRMDALLGEATALDSATLHAALAPLMQEFGVLEWNPDLGHYELIADATTRGQFQQWLRHRQAQLTPDAIRNLFVRTIAKAGGLGEIQTDFGRLHEVATNDWFYTPHYAQRHTIEQAIKTAAQDWAQSLHPNTAKGHILYLYLYPTDDLPTSEAQIQQALAAECKRLNQPLLPLWVAGIEDREGVIAEHLGRLHLFDESLSAEEQERLRRFIPEARTRSQQALKNAITTALKERLYWIAGFDGIPDGRMKAVGAAIFARVYPQLLPFPFDGFATASGGGAADAAQLMRSLIARQVDGLWVQAQPKRLQNRVQELLVKSWRVLASTGKLIAPEHSGINAALDALQQVHLTQPTHTLWSSYQMLIAPPYGLNSASAGVLLALLIGGQHPPRRLEQNGALIAAADWLGLAFPTQKGKHSLEPAVLERTTLRFLSEDAEGRWRALLERWEHEQHYERLVKLAQDAERMQRVDPIPEVLEGTYSYLRDRSEQAAVKLRQFKTQLDDWEQRIERAERQNNVGELLHFASQLHQKQHDLSDAAYWPESAVAACQQLLSPVREMIAARLADWIPRQSCHNAIDVGSFRRRIEQATASLTELGFTTEAQALEEQARRAIFQVETRQHFALTLAESDDYPRQPEPSDSTLVRALLDDIEQGERLIVAVEQARGTLDDAEIQARIHAIRQRQQRLRTQLDHQRAQLSALYDATLDSEDAVRDAQARALRLQPLFIDTRDASEVSALNVQLERILSDVAAWDVGDWAVERLEDLLGRQVAQQLAELAADLAARELEPSWDMVAIYARLLQQRLTRARQRSIDWIARRWLDAAQIAELDAETCARMMQELSAAPTYLAAAERARLEPLCQAVAARQAELDAQARQARIQAWLQPLLALAGIKQFDLSTTEHWLKTARQPPDTLDAEECTLLAPIIAALTAHLDSMSVADIMQRIAQLPLLRQQELFTKLTALITATGSND